MNSLNITNMASGYDDLPKAQMRLVTADEFSPLTSEVDVQVKSYNRRGAVLILSSPFIDGCHILMDVHNIIPKLVEILMAVEGGQVESKVGEVVRFNRLSKSSSESVETDSLFLLEIGWVSKEGSGLKSRLSMWGPFGRTAKPSRQEIA